MATKYTSIGITAFLALIVGASGSTVIFNMTGTSPYICPPSENVYFFKALINESTTGYYYVNVNDTDYKVLVDCKDSHFEKLAGYVKTHALSNSFYLAYAEELDDDRTDLSSSTEEELCYVDKCVPKFRKITVESEIE